jgi:hypothetical protein
MPGDKIARARKRIVVKLKRRPQKKNAVRSVGTAFGDMDKAKAYYQGIGRYDLAQRVDKYRKGGAETNKAGRRSWN